ncbi:hypothetical protein B0H14DRAFT_2654289 [Mycena olivaceomarginata]|nr:hypothetical protein B0H14DRAFT_2654289 [Mycena olivaceomarginata]
MEDRSDVLAMVTNVTRHMHRGFPHLLALWGATPLPPPPPPPHPYFCTPTWLPWAGPVVDTANESSAQIAQWKREGRALPAHIYSEHSSPFDSPWWPAPIQKLFGKARAEEHRVNLAFVLKYHVLHPDRNSQPPAFLHQHSLLLARLTCTYAIFFLRTRLQEHVTAATAPRAGAILAARREQAAAGARAAAVYTYSLMQDDFLSAWLTRPSMDVYLWGTVHDLRTLPPPPAPSVMWGGGGGGWGTPGAGDWGGSWEYSSDDGVGPWYCLDWST